ncbi:MAG TPA: extracellular solute-binding protein [Firmicutes bacterium]|nr:extracellular solute-binding protein [Bacillota bacterium]
MQKRLLSLVCLTLILMVALAPITAAAERTKIVFMFRGGKLQSELVNFWKEDFEQKNPDIEVEWREATGNWMDQIPVWVATGVGPDVFETWGNAASSWGENGVSLDLNPYVARDFTAQEINDFYPISWDACELTYGPKKGLRFGIPSYGNVFVLYYNADYFRQAGVQFPEVMDQQGDWNWDTFVTVAKKLTRSDGTKTIQWGLDDDSLYYPTGRGAGWVQAAGGQYFDLPDNPAKFVGDSEAVIAAFDYQQDLIWTHGVLSPIDTRSQANFQRGNSAMNLWLGSVRLTDAQTAHQFDWNIGPRPMGPAARGYYLASDMFSINAYSEHKEEAWRFVKYLTSTEGMIAAARIMGRGPVRQSAFRAYADLYPGRNTQYVVEGMLTGVLSPATFMSKDADNLINKTVREEIAPNKKSARQALMEIADALKALMQ